ncbi:exosome nuclease subunit [Coniochaeta pulveracea]|uniref:Exosome nuclease subunit n=1 Tax=Coniochaeta pulveracea TaxID=177199 RepID=A0A420XW28_9PEZI|nr:exosome nuclease subunit [Coniochaeta pulveracea]
MDASQDFKSLQDKVQSALVAATRSANGVAREDLSFLRTVDPTVSSKLDENSSRLLRLAQNLLESAGKFHGQQAPKLEDADDVDINWRSIVDVVDTLLEKADTCLDEYTGLVKRKDAPTAETGRASKKPKSTNDKLEWSMKRANIIKPQNAFERKVDNFDTGAFRPLLSSKPHATVPLEESLVTYVDDFGNPQYKHPYETEIQDLKYPKQVYEKTEPILYHDVEKTSAVWVDTYEGVLEMLAELKKAKEIAVDLEHHDYRTYPGLLSLMQISTRDKDWIVDTLRPWRHKLEVLNEVFADPNILKVFHGAYMDIIWLQRDLGLYIVGLFDTYCVCDALQYPGRSLAYLLKKFVDFDADKKYQMADWRIRPIPEEMLYYARSDTHYLLYIFDMLRNEILDSTSPVEPGKPLMDTILDKSKEVSLGRYETMLCDKETGQGTRGWFNILVKGSGVYNAEQFSVYKTVFKWRDDLARKEDESPMFIMHFSAVGDIARVLPEDPKALWSLLGNVSQPVKSRIDELFALIQQARKEGETGPTMLEFFRENNSMGSVARRVFDRKPKSKAPEVPLPDISELRADKSQMFGDMPISSRWEETGKAVKDDMHIALPWTAYVQQQADEDARLAKAPVNQEIDMIPLETESKVEVPEDDGFTLKQGRKRKANDAELPSEPTSDNGNETKEEESAQASEIELVDEDAAQKLAKKEKKERRKQRKAAKAAKAAGKEDADMQDGAEAEEEDEQPFDYSAAQSVLRAQQQNSDNTGGRGRKGKKEKVFDPYTAKTEGTIKGARKMNYEKAGRTATFKK